MSISRTGKLKVLKVFSTPADPSPAVLDVLAQIGADRDLDVRHGTTVGTNTMLERTGARVAFVTTAGFEDTIAIGRQTRRQPLRLVRACAGLPGPARTALWRAGARQRRRQNSPLSDGSRTGALVEAVRASGAEAVAISLLFSFANPETERRVEAALQCLGIPISTSHRILPEFREYERASTTVVNAYLAPRCRAIFCT